MLNFTMTTLFLSALLLVSSSVQPTLASKSTSISTSVAAHQYSNAHDDQILDFLMNYKEYMLHVSSTSPNKQYHNQVNLTIDIPQQQDQQIHREVEEEESGPQTTKADFVKLCTEYLLSDDITNDDEISNEEAASFFEYLCDNLPKPSCQNQSIPFYSLLLEIQFLFVNAICPGDLFFLETTDRECIDALRDQVDNKQSFAYNTTSVSEEQLDQDITDYCSNVYAYSSEFHFGTYAPSPSPSISTSPTLALPTKSPTPTIESSISPTASPSVSPKPSSIVEYETAFTYMMGFNDEQVAANVADDERKDILDSTSDAVVTVLNGVSSSLIFDIFGGGGNDRRRNYHRHLRSESSLRSDVIDVSEIENDGNDNDNQLSRHLIEQLLLQFTTTDGNNGIEHLYKKEAACEEDLFEESTDCVIIVSQVNLQSSSKNKITKELVSNVIYEAVKLSMRFDDFRDLIGIQDVIEVKYLSDGNEPPPTNEPRTGGLGPPIGVGGGSIAGITIGSVLLLLLLAFFVGRARARSEDRSVSQDDLSDDDYQNEEEDGSDGDDNDDPALVSTSNGKSINSRQPPLVGENVESTDQSRNEDKSLAEAGLQFDPASGNVVGSAAVSYASSYKSIGSGYSADDPETPGTGGAIDSGDVLVDKLDEAVHAGDWAAVAAIAGDLSQADDISTMSSFHSKGEDISYAPSERSSLAPQDAKRAAKIDQLIAEGDWNAVGATAAAFESEMSEDSPEKGSLSNQEQGTSTRGRSLLDFISGPWQSMAASKAVENENIVSDSDPEAPFANFESDPTEEEQGEEEEEEKTAPFTNVNDGLSLSDPSDLSAGEPKSPSKTTETLVALGTVGAAGAAAAAVYHSESDTTDDDKKQLISPTQKKKRSWAGRFLRRKSDHKKKVASSSLALQEDSSVSSWSKGEESPPDITLNPYGIAQKPADGMPAEMKVFGEDHGLAVAEQAMKEEDERKQRKLNDSNIDESETELSQKSSNSLRDELDKAIETGDWATVEKQTNEMLDAGKRKSNLLSEIDSDVDSEALEGWSQDGGPADYESEAIDDDRIEMLEKLIETDDWQGIVDDSQIHAKSESSTVKD